MRSLSFEPVFLVYLSKLAQTSTSVTFSLAPFLLTCDCRHLKSSLEAEVDVIIPRGLTNKMNNALLDNTDNVKEDDVGYISLLLQNGPYSIGLCRAPPRD